MVNQLRDYIKYRAKKDIERIFKQNGFNHRAGKGDSRSILFPDWNPEAESLFLTALSLCNSTGKQSIYRNQSGYFDPTAGAALTNTISSVKH